MAKSTSIKTLMAAHEKQMTSAVKKELSNTHYATNPNEIWWVHEEPQLQKQFGRAARIYNRMRELNDLD